jgi:hypothetical protein
VSSLSRELPWSIASLLAGVSCSEFGIPCILFYLIDGHLPKDFNSQRFVLVFFFQKQKKMLSPFRPRLTHAESPYRLESTVMTGGDGSSSMPAPSGQIQASRQRHPPRHFIDS